MILRALGFFFAVAVGSAAAAPDAASLGARLDEKPAGVRKVNGILYFPHDGKTVDFGDRALRWTGAGDYRSQRESQSAIIEIQGRGVTVRRAWIVQSPDGIHVKNADAVIENVVFPDVGEDAITADRGADRLVIRNCVFRGAEDKAIQLNGGRDIVVENCYFENCAKPVRAKPGVTVTVRNCFSKNSTAFALADGKGAVVRVEGNHVRDSKYFVEAMDGARIIVGPGNVTRGIRFPDTAIDGGTITVDPRE